MPTEVTVTRGNSSLTVRWKEPDSDGGSSIISYGLTVTAGATVRTFTLSPALTSATVSGLRNGTTYSVRMVATNVLGDSSQTATVTGVPSTVAATVPAAPIISSVSTATSRTLTIVYRAGSNNGSTISAFEYSINGGSSWTNASASPLVISGLTNGTTYPVMLRARNYIGAGASVTRALKPVATRNFIAFTTPTPMTFGDDNQLLVATATGGTVSFESLTPTVCGIESGALQALAAGTCRVKATNPGTDVYAAAVAVTKTVVIRKATQELAMNAFLPMTTLSANQQIVATATAGTVLLTSLTPTVCSIVSASYLRAIKTGTCTVRASNLGSANYLPAAPVTRTMIITIGTPTPSASASASASVSASPTASISPTPTPSPTSSVATIRLTSADTSSMTDKSAWWTDNPANRSWVKFLTAGDVLTLNYVVTKGDAPVVGKTVTLDAVNAYDVATNFTGTLSGVTDSNGAVTFTLTNTDSSGEPRPVSPSTMSYWDNSRSVDPEVGKNFTPSLESGVATTVNYDRVWVRVVDQPASPSPSPTVSATTTSSPTASATATASASASASTSPTPATCAGVPSAFITGESFSNLSVVGNGDAPTSTWPLSNSVFTFTYSDVSLACKSIQLNFFNISSGLSLHLSKNLVGASSTACDPAPAAGNACYITLNASGLATFTVTVVGATTGSNFSYILVGPGWSSATSGGIGIITFDGGAAPTATATASSTPTPSTTPSPTASASATSLPSNVQIRFYDSNLQGPAGAWGNQWWNGNAPSNNYVRYVLAGSAVSLSFAVSDASGNRLGAGIPVTLSGYPSGAGTATFTGSMSSTTNSSGVATFSLANTNSDSNSESYRADLTVWTDALGSEYKYDFAPSVPGATADIADLVWTHVVSNVDNTPPTPTPSASPDISGTLELLWSDEFTGSSSAPVDASKWFKTTGDGCAAPDYNCGWGNGERQSYQPDASALDGNGNLVITATRLPANTNLNCYYGKCEWKSGKLTTFGKAGFTYGYLEARISGPAGAGNWPAFWMLGTDIYTNPWPRSGEIDIYEVLGSAQSTNWGTAHFADAGGGRIMAPGGNTVTLSTPTVGNFHTYGVLWKPGTITWYIDGIARYTLRATDYPTSQWPFGKTASDTPRFYAILNTAMGGIGGAISPTMNSSQLTVDYVRYYSVNGQGTLTTY